MTTTYVKGDRVKYVGHIPAMLKNRYGTINTAYHNGSQYGISFDGTGLVEIVHHSHLVREVKAVVGVPFGGKDDSAKTNPRLLTAGCPNAISAVVNVLHHGAKKYSAHSWQKVENGVERYLAAAARHQAAIDKDGVFSVNPDFNLLHLDHMICDLMFVRELIDKEYRAKQTVQL